MDIIKWIKEEKPIFAWTPVIIWAVIILVLSVLPYRVTPQLTVSYLDKMLHLFFYLVFSYLVLRSFLRAGRKLDYGEALFALILGGCYGIVIEVLQRYVPGRDPCMNDAMYNILGALIGILIGRWILWQR